MSDSSRRFQDASRNIQIAGFSGLILRVFLLSALNHYDFDINVHNYSDFFNIYFAISISAVLVLLVGTCKNNHYFIIPYLVITIIEIPLTSIALIFDLVMIVHSLSYKMFIELLVGFFIIFWNFFTTWLLINNYRQMELQQKLERQIAQLETNEHVTTSNIDFHMRV